MSIKSSTKLKFFTTHLFEVNRRLLEPKKNVCILLAGLAGTLFFLIGGVFAALGVSYFFRNHLVKQLSKETLDSTPKKVHETLSQKIEKITSEEIELSSLEDLPNEMKLCVFNYLTVKEVARMREVCSIMKDFVNGNRKISQTQRLAKEKRLEQEAETKKDAQLVVEEILKEIEEPFQGFCKNYTSISKINMSAYLHLQKLEKLDVSQDSKSQQRLWEFDCLSSNDVIQFGHKKRVAIVLNKIIIIDFLKEDEPKLIELNRPTVLSEKKVILLRGLDSEQLKDLGLELDPLHLKHLELCFNLLAEKVWASYENPIEYKNELTRKIWIKSFAGYLKENKDQLIKDLSDDKLAENVSLMCKKRLEKIKGKSL